MGSNENNTNKQKKKGKAGKIIKIIVIVLLVLILIPILILVGAVLFGGGICGFGGLGGIALWLFNQEKEVTPDNSDDSYYIEVSIDDVPDEISGGDSYIESVEVVDRELVSVELAALPDRLDYYINDELDITGMELIAKYDDGSEKDVTDSVMVNPVILSKAGTQTVTVSYIDYTTTFTVNVKKEGIEWSLKNGTLTIIGRGPMDDYDQYSAADWKMRKDDIVEIVIEKGVTSVGDFAFAECENLKRVTLPEGLVSIGESAFNSCPLLESVNLPNGLKSVDAWAFGGCSSIEVFEIPASVSSIADYAFAPCEMLTAINVDEDNSYYSSHYGVLLNKKQTKLIQYPENKENTKYAVPETVTTICKAAFYSCNRLVEINFDDDITVIEDYALYDSEHLTRINYNGTMSRWKTIRFGTQWRYNTDFDIIYCTDGELYLNGSSDGDNNGGGGNSGGIVYRTSVAGTNYARRATYSVSKEGETDPSYIYVGGAWSD